MNIEITKKAVNFLEGIGEKEVIVYMLAVFC